MIKVSVSKSFKQFLNTDSSKIASIITRQMNKSYMSNLFSSDEIDYLTFRTDGTISFLPDGKELKYNDQGDWSRDGRQNAKAGKCIRKIMHKRLINKLKDSDFEEFANRYKKEFNDDGFVFDLKNRDEIINVYCMDLAEGDSSLSGSCMNGDKNYLKIYASCERLKILTLINSEGELAGRALVWTLDDGITLMDRVYVAKDFMYDLFIDECTRRGWWRKKYYKTYDNKDTFINPSGEQVSKLFKVYTDTDFEYYPYIDTFSYGGDGFLSNNCSDADGGYTYSSTGGDRDDDTADENENRSYDELNDCYIDDCDAAYIDNGERQYIYRTTHEDNVVYVSGYGHFHENDCHIVEISGTWYAKDSGDVTYLESYDDWFKTDDCVYCDIDESDELESDCVYSEHHSTYILKENAVQVCGKYFHKDDVNDNL